MAVTARQGRLVDVATRARWTGTRALALRTAAVTCGCGPVYSGTFTQPALFYHGGYGAAVVVRSLWCLCGKIRIRDEAVTSPRWLI